MTGKLIGLRIDLETKSATDIKFGAYRYFEDPQAKVLICSYAPLRQFPGGGVKMGKPRTLSSHPDDVRQFKSVVMDPGFQKHAFNSNFERIGLSHAFGLPPGEYLDPENWHCSAVLANTNGVFGTLDEVAKAVRAPITKDPEGKRLIRLFSIPDRRTKMFHTTGGSCWCGENHHDDFVRYQSYCEQDVMTEAVVAAAFPPMPEFVQHEYEADQRINDRGIRHFKGLSLAAVEQVATERDRLMGELRALTGVDNPNSVQQMRRWLDEQGYPMTSLDKASRAEALDDPLIPDEVAEALVLKGAASLSSVQKHQAALDTRCADGRIRGSLRFYGAHTGREAGRGIQPQNLPRLEASTADRHKLLRGLAGEDAPEIAKGTVRASLVPAKGHVFAVADYNAIEARCLGWQAQEEWVQEEFRGEGKIYEATAATMFGIDKAQLVAALARCKKCGTCSDCAHREKGKVSNLALGYEGGAGALVTMGAESAGIDCGNYTDLHKMWEAAGSPGRFHEWNRDMHDYPELLRLRDLYRDASPMTRRFWKLCAKAWDVSAIDGKGARFGGPDNRLITIQRDGRHNRLILPSGRSIWYRHARSHVDPKRTNRDGTPRIDRRTFMGKGKGIGHMRTDTHGGKLTENITQAVARDVLFDLIMRIEGQKNQPGRIVLHVHDEVVLEVPEKHAEQRLADVLGMMSEPPSWADGLMVKGAGSIMERYGK